MQKSFRRITGLSVGCALAALSVPTMAQTGATPPQANGESGIEEIIVTATKREESLQRVGTTVAAFSGDTLSKLGSGNVADLTKIVPGLTFAISPTSTPVYTLRGVGYYETSLAASPAVSVYVDQVPLAFPALTSEAALDLERVEVLKGPQGILFGSNSTGGAINYIAAKPTRDLQAGLDLTYGRFNTVEAKAFVSGPLSDTLSARIAVKHVYADDWQYSYTRNDTTGKKRLFSGRAIIDWQPSEGIKFELAGTIWQDRSDPQSPQYVAATPTFPAQANPIVLAYPTAPNNNRATDWSPGTQPRGRRNFYQGSLRADFDVTNDITVTSISSYARYNQDQVVEGDGTAFSMLDHDPVIGRIQTFFQELRVANASRSAFRWVIGANYQDSKVYENDFLKFADVSFVPVFGFVNSKSVSDQKIRNVSVFGNVDFDVTDRLTLKAGLRYEDDRSRTTSLNLDSGDGRNSAFYEILQAQFISLGLKTTPIVPIAPGSNVALNPATYSPEPYNAILSEHNLSFRVGFDYKIADDVLFYGNISRGYKTGNFPTLGASTWAAFAPVTQESVVSYEAGLKSQLFNRTLQLNAAGFYYGYSNKQIKSKILDAIFGPLDALVNIPKSRLQGGEVSVIWAPVRGLSLNGAVTYLDSKVTRFIGVNGTGVLENFAGSRIPYAPKWQATAGGDYTFPLTTGWNGSFGVTFAYNSATTSIVGNDPLYQIKAYKTLDLRAGVTGDNGLSLSVFARNVTNEFYWVNTVKSFDIVARYAGAPATYGATLSYRFR